MKMVSLKILATAALVAGTSSAIAQTKWNAASAYAPENYHTENYVQFAKDVATATNGEYQITVHPNASLFKSPEIKQAVQTGQAEIGEIPIPLLENENALFGAGSLPFIAQNMDEAKKLLDASREIVEQKLAQQGLVLLYTVPWPAQGIYTARPLNTIEDMKGLKWRSSLPIIAKIGNIVGAQPVTIQEADLPQALATGVVDSYLSSSMTGYNSKTWETLKYYYNIKAYVVSNMVFMNKDVFDALSDEVKTAIMGAAEAAEKRGWQIAPERDAWFIAELAKNGMTVSEGSPELLAGLRSVGEKLVADWLTVTGDEGQAILDNYKKSVGAN